MYGYAGNNPLTYLDPTGLCTVVNGVYVEDGGNPCPAPPSGSVTVNGGGDGSNLTLPTPGTCYVIVIDG
jgi:hypothetical protein